MKKLTYADFSDDAVQTMQWANYASRRLKHDHLGTEHILIGLCLNLHLHPSESMFQLGIDPKTLIPMLRPHAKPGTADEARGRILPQPDALRVTKHATEDASILRCQEVHNGHVLLGMLFVNGSVACEVLNSIGLQYDHMLTQVKRMQSGITNRS